jgi:two-component system NarL family response regulator
MTEGKKIRVMVIDDHFLVRVGVRAIVNAEIDMEVVAEAPDGPSGLRAFDEHHPDVTLVDLRMPSMSGPEIIGHIRRRDPQAKILVLTSYDTDEDVFRALRAGATGYLLKGTFPEGVLEAAIRTLHAGRRHIPTEVAEKLASRMDNVSLSPREIAVLALVAKGLSNAEIGTALSTTAGTVKTHLKRIFIKLGVNDRTAAALIAVQRGLVMLN